MKLILSLLTLSVLSFGQLFEPITDAPQHGIALGVGVGPTTKDVAVAAGFAEKLPGTAATYSYTGVSVVPALVPTANGGKSLQITPVVHTGLKQVVFQKDRLSLYIDAGAGVSLPATISPAWNFAGVTAAGLTFRVNKDRNAAPGGTNHYIAIEPRFTQLSGSQGGVVISLNIAWLHGINGK